MRIKSIEMLGFKSFLEKTALAFSGGITAVVGPNGCGKSNVVDAVRWVLGEQNPRLLRGRLMEDLIFNGSESRKPVGMAEVNVLFENRDGTLPEPFRGYPEITVGRRVYRSGESEYTINRVPCRLKDVAELFMDSGAGSRTYSIIEQGRVGQIVGAKPEDRRVFFDEAAGIMKYRTRRAEAERKMEATRQNLVHVESILAEVARQLSSLNRQAKKAERYRRLKEETRALDLALLAHQHRGLVAERDALGGEIQRLRIDEAAATLDVGRREAQSQRLRLSILEEEAALAEARERLFAVESAIQAAEANLEMGRRELASLTQGDQQRAVRIGSLGERLAGMEGRLAEARGRHEDLDQRAWAVRERLAERERCIEERKQALASLRREIEGNRDRLVDLVARVTKSRSDSESAVRRLEELGTRLARKEAEGSRVAQALEDMETRLGTCRDTVSGLNARKALASMALKDELRLLKAARETLHEKEDGLDRLRASLGVLESRLATLRDFQERHEGYDDGVRAILAKAAQSPNGVLGVVADFLDAPREYEGAVEAALGDRLGYVVVKSATEGLEAVEYLRGQGSGRGSFLPLDAVGEIPVSLSFDAPLEPIHAGGNGGKGGNGGNGSTVGLREVVRVKEGMARVADALLGQVKLVSSLTEALSLRRANGRHPVTFVTPMGDVLDSTGILHGGGRKGAEGGPLAVRRRIRELEEEREGSLRAVEKAHTEREEASGAVSGSEARIETMTAALREDEEASIRAAHELGTTEQAFEGSRELSEILGFEKGQLAEEIESTRRAIEESRQIMAVMEEEKSSLEAAGEDGKTRTVDRQGEMEEVRIEATSLAVSLAAIEAERSSALREVNDLEKDCEDLRQATAAVTREREEACERRTGIERDLERASAEKEDGIRDRESVAGEVEERKRGRETMLSTQAEVEVSLKNLRHGLSEITDRIHEKGVREGVLGADLRNLRAAARERWGVELGAEPAKAGPAGMAATGEREEESGSPPKEAGEPAEETEETLRAKRERLAQVQNIIASMGEVNPGAIEEHNELKTRHEFLVAQRDDLVQSLDALGKAITKINRTSRDLFLETFRSVDSKFREIFPRLFKGGQAELRLTDEEDPLEAGVEIVAQPPGKSLKSVNLLSGGEKALTAVALIFSLFLVKPSPFCLLDEVDAPLDDVNIDRFNDLVREMSTTSQFVLITHNKRSMEMADTLYGVTMEEAGVSRIISVSFAEQAVAA